MEKQGKFAGFLRDVWEVGQGSRKAFERLKTAGHLEEGQDSLGGFLVSEDVYDDIMEIVLEDSIVMPRAQALRFGKGNLGISTLVDTTHASNVFGGIVVYHTAEAAALTVSNPALGKLVLHKNKLTGFCYVSNELMSDSDIAIETFFRRTFGAAIAYYTDDDYINGTGVDMPLGIRNSSCRIDVSKESEQAGTTILWDNVKKMDSRLLPQSNRKAVWLIHPDTKPQLYDMVQATADTYIHTTMNLAGGHDGMFMLGHPIIPTEKCQTLGTSGDIILADFSQYVIATGGLQIAVSEHPAFNADETAWRFVLRYDGQPILNSAITPKNGTTTLSPFVTLAVRE